MMTRATWFKVTFTVATPPGLSYKEAKEAFDAYMRENYPSITDFTFETIQHLVPTLLNIRDGLVDPAINRED